MSQSDDIFNFSEDKLALLDQLLAEEGLAETAAAPAILPRPQSDDPLPLSFAQQRLWFLQTFTPNSSLYNTPLALRLTGALDKAALSQACQAFVQRHESLRTTFTAVSGTPRQIIHDSWPVTLAKVCVTAVELDAALQSAVQHPFDLEEGPLLRFHLLRLDQTEHILLLVFHHLVFDGWSASIIVAELAELYEAIYCRQQPDLPELPIQYADYALWQRDWLTGETLQTQLDYWQEQLAGDLPLLQLPTDKPRPAVKSYRGAVESILLSPPLTAQVMALCQQTGSTPFMLLLAAFKVLLHRYTAQTDVWVGTPIANRQPAELEGLVGFFVNTLVLRSQVNGRETFQQLLARVRDTATAAYENPDVPFEKLVELLQPERDLSHDPLFQVMFTYQYGNLAERPLPNLTITPMNLDNGIAQFDLVLSVSQEAEQFRCGLNYSTDLFEPETIRRMLGHWQTLLAGLVTEPDKPVGQLDMLTPAEKQQLLLDWNDTAVSLPQTNFAHERFLHWVQQTPEAPALIYGQQQMNYAELNAKANQLAHVLQTHGVGPESKVGIFVSRSFEMVMALLAVWKAGGAYVPLDPNYPQERLQYMITDADLALILTVSTLCEKLPAAATAVCLDQGWDEQIAAQPTSNPISQVTLDNLAYVIYTSGSTGRPKGVGVTHRGLVNFGLMMAERCKITASSRVLQFASFSFDASVADFLLTLLNGAMLVLANSEALLMGPSFVQLMQQQMVSVVTLPPSALALLNPADFPALCTVISAGEACSAEIVAKWAPGRHFVNAYGPTEGTVGALTAVLAADNLTPVIGQPLPNTQVYLLNPQLQPVPLGVAGEIHIAGRGLARGYLNRPDLTAEKFIPNPFGTNGGDRLYKTGDLGRYLPDGRIEFLGRIDHQVKIRGFRIELGEVEAALRQHTAVHDALVLARETVGGPQLVAYVVGEAEQLGDLRPFLSHSLPAYMIPSAFVVLERFPQTPNGKIDRKALPAPDGTQAVAEDATFVAPQDALESQLLRVWQNVLQLPAISTQANYFELGGHSLQAVKLFAAIEKELAVRLPVSLLFEAPTVGQLAAAIRQRGEGAQWSSLVPIQPLGSKTPFFCVHGGAGHVFHYHDLAQLLGTERPFYGLQPKMDPSTHLSVYKYVKDMATHYIEEMKMVQPKGPYLLGGFCFGGIVVYQMAQQLRRAGDEVGLLVFIDPSTPKKRRIASQVDSPEAIAQRLARHKDNMSRLGQIARLRYILNSTRNRLTATWNHYHRAGVKLWHKSQAKVIREYINWRGKVPSYLSDIYFMHVIVTPATYAYRPRPYPGEAILFSSALENGGDKSLGWSDLPQEGLKVYEVESTHLGILKRPYIDLVAAQLKQHLEPFA